MKNLKVFTLIFLGCLFFHGAVKAQEQEVIYTKMAKAKKESATKKTYLIEREIPDAGQLTHEQLKGISQKSCSVLKQMGTGIEWVHSYVTTDKVYCVYKAENEALIREHAQKGGFPVNSIQELASKIGPETANE